MRIFKRFGHNTAGAVTVETSLLIGGLILLSGGAIEASYAFYQYNGAQIAARTGARIAATYDPVSRDMRNLNTLNAANYARTCSSETRRCSQGGYDGSAMQAIVYGPDLDGACGATNQGRRGMCDVFNDVQLAHVDVSYSSAGLTTSGRPDPAPIVTVTLRDVPLNFAFLDMVGFKNIATLPSVEVTVMGEDLKNG